MSCHIYKPTRDSSSCIVLYTSNYVIVQFEKCRDAMHEASTICKKFLSFVAVLICISAPRAGHVYQLSYKIHNYSRYFIIKKQVIFATIFQNNTFFYKIKNNIFCNQRILLKRIRARHLEHKMYAEL